MTNISQIPLGYHRQKTKLSETSWLHKTKTDRKLNLLNVLNSLTDVNARIMKNIYTTTILNQHWNTEKLPSE